MSEHITPAQQAAWDQYEKARADFFEDVAEDHLRDCVDPGSSPLCEDYDCVQEDLDEYDPADDLYREERAAARYDASDAAYERAAEIAWARGTHTLSMGVVLAERTPVAPRRMFTARPRKVSWRERARDIFADIKVRMDHEEAITRW